MSGDRSGLTTPSRLVEYHRDDPRLAIMPHHRNLWNRMSSGGDVSDGRRHQSFSSATADRFPSSAEMAALSEPTAQAAPPAGASASDGSGDATAAQPDAKKRDREAERERRVAQLNQLFADLGIDTGDVVIFDRKCTAMSLYGAAICATAKVFGRTQWDHNGVVIRDPQTGELLFLEAAMTGVKMRPLVERVLRSQSFEVAVRKLQVHRTPEFRARAFEFATEILNSPYEDRPQRLFNAGVPVPQRVERERLFHALISHKKELQRLDSELQHRHKMPEFERNALVQERNAVHEKYHRLVEELSQTERSMFENELLLQPTQKRKMFCSQLVASLYQHLGLLLPYPSANSYVPKHFSTGDTSQYLKLNQDATLTPEISLRKALDETAARQRRRVEESESREPREPHELAAIVTCLRRHPLFHMLSESELHSVASKFRRREVDNGEIVFYQGEDGGYFYIIQQGECDVFVDYNYLRETRTEEEEAHLSPAKLPANLRRRKTLALPDFSSSSSMIDKNQRVLVATNGPGSAFGDSALIYETPRRATIQAKSSVVLWQLDKPSFRQIIAEHPGTQCSLEEYIFLMRALSDHPLFAELDDRAKALAVRKCFPLQFRAGTTILNQGDSGDYFYVIESGKCEILRQKPQLKTPVIDREIGSGSSFGEAALLYNSRRGASVRALEDTKVWCMDRATFLTITRSGSSALFKMFQRVSSGLKDGSETFLTQRDLQRMLRAPRYKDLVTDASAGAPSRASLDRARRLAHSLLFHDASGLVNFSQFAHFHITLGPATMEQLLPEAAFRILNELAIESSGELGDMRHTSCIRLRDIVNWMRQWRAIDFSRETTAPVHVSSEESKAMEELFKRLLDLPAQEDASDRRVTCDDLARVILNLGEVGRDDDSTRYANAVTEMEGFLASLKADLGVLRNLWRAAEFRAGGDVKDEFSRGKKALTFDANLRTGWISAMRHNSVSEHGHGLEGIEDDSQELANTQRTRVVSQVTSLIAAITAGGLSRTACAPLERLKILMQISAPTTVGAPLPASTVSAPYGSAARGLVNMVRLSGVRGLYSGNLAHCLWVVPSLPTKFLLCDVYRNQMTEMGIFAVQTGAVSPRERRYAADLQNLLAGGLAGVTANCLFYPLDVVRGRLTVQQYFSSERLPYKGIWNAFSKMRMHESTSAFYRGFTPASLGVFSYIGSNYAIYEFLRPYFILYDTDTSGHQLGHPSVPGQILCATAASIVSQTVSYPFDLLRRRMQLGGSWHPEIRFPTYKSTWECLTETMRGADGSSSRGSAGRFFALNGVTRLYQGLFVNSVKAVPSVVVSFVSYEKIREWRLRSEEQQW